MGFALFSLGEYSNILIMSSFCTILFFGGWLPINSFFSIIPGAFWFASKIIFFVILFVLLRAGLPRYRYDQLMEIGWQVLLLATLVIFISIYTALILLNGLPF